LEFRVAEVQAGQVVAGSFASLKVYSYEELAREERNRQIASAVLVGVAAGANAAAASQAGNYRSNSVVNGPNGTYTVSTTGYSPTAAAIAQSNANIQNEAMISATIAQGQANLSNLEKSVIKDNTLLPGEWYGGQLHIEPLANSGETKSYHIVIMVGADRHEIEIDQESTH
jgi:hypothetical protein